MPNGHMVEKNYLPEINKNLVVTKITTRFLFKIYTIDLQL